jgi:hypothetical protein
MPALIVCISENVMTASTGLRADAPSPPGPNAPAALAIGLIAAVSVLALLVSAITFGALAIAFPLVGDLVERFSLTVTPADLALAERFAELWWVFGVFAGLSIAAAGFVAVKAVQFLSPAPRD